MFRSAERGPGGPGEALDEGLDDGGALTVTVFVTDAAGCEPPHADRAAAAVTATAAIRVLTNITGPLRPGSGMASWFGRYLSGWRDGG